MPAAESAAATVSPGSAATSPPSKVMQAGSAARAMSGWQRRMPLPRRVGSGTVSLIPSSMNGPIAVQQPFRGTYTVLITPFTADGAAVDLKALERLVEFQIAEGIDGL